MKITRLNEIVDFDEDFDIEENDFDFEDDGNTITFSLYDNEFIKTVDVQELDSYCPGHKFEYTKKSHRPYIFGNDKYIINDLYMDCKSEKRRPYQHPFGWIIIKNDMPLMIIYMYEPHSLKFNEKRGLITFYGHEHIINLWLDDLSHDKFYTRR